MKQLDKISATVEGVRAISAQADATAGLRTWFLASNSRASMASGRVRRFPTVGPSRARREVHGAL